MPTIPPMSWLRLLAANPFPLNPPKADGFLFQPEFLLILLYQCSFIGLHLIRNKTWEFLSQFIQDIQNILFSLVGTDGFIL